MIGVRSDGYLWEKRITGTHQSNDEQDYSFFKEMPEPCLAAFFSFSISFFCLFDLGGLFCVFFCSLFATISSFTSKRRSIATERRYVYCIKSVTIPVAIVIGFLYIVQWSKQGSVQRRVFSCLTYFERLMIA